MKRYIVERTNEAEIRPKEKSEKAESFQENLWNEIQLKGPLRRKQTQEQNKKRSGQAQSVCVKNKLQHPHHLKMRLWGQNVDG